MSAILQLEVAVFHLIPLSDRLVEREHLYLGQVARPKTGITLGHHYSIKRLLVLPTSKIANLKIANLQDCQAL